MERLWRYMVPILVLLLFIAVMNGKLYKLTLYPEKGDDFPHYLQALKEDVTDEQWIKVQGDYDELTALWKNMVERIQFSVEKDQIEAIDVNLARMQAYIELRDKKGVVVELLELKEHWKNINN